ncbi:MAG: glycosyltransferase [Desulfobacterales bacterium]|nr:glycosyltransferase [Desulfobacterales bacterium]
MLTEAVESCLDQKNVSLEVIIVDDGSTDGSVDSLAYIPNIKIIKQSHLGACAARNRGIHEAKGQFIKFLDSDDKLVPNILSIQTAHLIKSQADVVYGDFEMFGNLGDPRVAGLPHRVTGCVDDPVDALLGDWWCAPFCYMYRREAIGSQRWTEDLECLQDFDFILSFALRGKKFVYQPGITGFYRMHQNQITGNSAYRYAVNRCKILERILDKAANSNTLTDNRKFLIAHGFWTAARTFYRSDKKRFHEAVAKVHSLIPRFWPEFWGIWPVRTLTGLMGIERAELLLSLGRKVLGNTAKLP